MSQTFFCPPCQIPIAELPLTAPATCQRCGQTYWYPNHPQQAKPVRPVSPPPPPEESVSSGPSIAERFHSATQRRFRPATSWFDLFDLKFQKYVTPMIIRLTWGIVLGLTALALLEIVVTTLGILVPQMESGAGARGSFPEIFLPQLPDWLTWRAALVLFNLVRFCVILLALLWIRVLLETAIVVFNIATTLSTMEQKLASLDK